MGDGKSQVGAGSWPASVTSHPLRGEIVKFGVFLKEPEALGITDLGMMEADGAWKHRDYDRPVQVK